MPSKWLKMLKKKASGNLIPNPNGVVNPLFLDISGKPEVLAFCQYLAFRKQMKIDSIITNHRKCNYTT